MSTLTTVRLYIYDISFGLASAYGSSLLGKQIDGVWHTGVGIYGREYLFGSSGVSYTAPEEIYRQGLAPKPKAMDLGQTKKSFAEIQAWISEKSATNFRGHRYDLLDWNCNNFSDEFTKYLLNSPKSLIPEEILELPRFVKSTPLGRMLMSFLNKDPISVAQQSGTTNNDAPESSMHMVESKVKDSIPARQCILPSINKMEKRISRIVTMSNRPLTTTENERLDEIQQLFDPNASYSPMLNVDHVKLLISLMINCVADQTGQRLILETLQLLSEYEYIVKLLGDIKGDESPIELFKGVAEQAEPVQIEFLRWFSSIAATSNGRALLIDVQDGMAPLLTDFILNESVTKKVKYEVIVILHNLLCINTDIRLSFMNTISIGSATVQYMMSILNEHEADTYLAVFVALADAEKDLYGIAKAMDFDPKIYSTIVACQPLVATISKQFETV